MKPYDRCLFLIFKHMIKKDKITDIFFDLDHTLWDFETNSAATFENILPPYNFPFSAQVFMTAYAPINHAYWKLYRENTITTEELRFVRLQKTFESVGYPQGDEVIHRISDAYIDQLSTHTHLFPGTLSLLEKLKKQYRLHIITNGFEQVQQKKMENSGIAGFFDVVLTAEKAGIKKPDSAIFKQALSLAASTPQKALMIGDSYEADIAGALTLGMQAIHFNSHEEPLHENCLVVNCLGVIEEYL